MAKILNFPPSNDQKISDAIVKYNDGNCKEAECLFRDLVDSGVDEAYQYLGFIYEYGCDEIAEDIDKAIFYYEQSIAEYGSLESILSLARIYRFDVYERLNNDKAYYYYSLAAEHEEPIADINLGRIYQYGYGVEQDISKAKALYEKAARAGYPYGYVFLAILTWKEKKRLLSLFYRAKALLQLLPIIVRNIEDKRLRAY